MTRHHHEILVNSGLVEDDRLSLDAVRDSVAKLGLTPVVTFLCDQAGHSRGPMKLRLHDDVVTFIRTAEPFEPDVEGLFAVYGNAGDGTATRILVEWVLGRTSTEWLVDRLRRFLASDEESERLLATELIRGARSKAGIEFPDFGGAGGQVAAPIPPPEMLPDGAALDDLERPEAAPPAPAPVGSSRSSRRRLREWQARRESERNERARSEAGRSEADRSERSEAARSEAHRSERRDAPTDPEVHEAAVESERREAREARWILAWIAVPDSDLAEPLPAFRANAPNEVSVVVDVPRERWLAAVGSSREESVDAKLPGTHKLTVLFQIPSLNETQTQAIDLPPSGPSDPVARFWFTAPPAGQRVDATITLLHGNRALQAAILSGLSFEDPTRVPAGFEASLKLAVITPRIEGIEDRRPLDASIVAGQGIRGPSAAGVSDGEAVPFDNEHLGPVVERIRNLLRRLADEAPSFAGGLETAGSVELLRALAFQGRDLYLLLGEPLERARSGAPLDRIQVILTHTDAFVPVEFVYDFPTPAADAALCRNWKQALADGRCDPANHPPSTLPGSVTMVCPVGFWAVRKVIERHVVEAEDADSVRGKNFAIRSEVTAERPSLDDLTGAVVAWSDKVDFGVPGQSSAVVAALNEVTGNRARPVRTWEEWVRAIDDEGPPLLVLLSHTVLEQGTQALEIGPEGGSRCLRVGLVSEFVKRGLEDRPVVLLLGCDTAVGRAEPQSFVARLREVGAALVVGTIAPVLGENAAPVAVQLIRELRATIEDPSRAQGERATFGETMLRVRKKLLTEGHLTSLCVTSVGDADWRLTMRAAEG